MSLAIALTLQNAGRRTDRICRHLRDQVPENVPLLLIDTGSSDSTPARLAAHAAESHARDVALAAPMGGLGIVYGLVRRLTGCRHLLLLGEEDRLAPGSVAKLASWLEHHDPEVAVIAGGWWLTEPQDDADVLAYPDMERLHTLPETPTTAELQGLTPDPRRVLFAAAESPAIDPFSNPLLAWNAWDDALKRNVDTRLFPQPVVLRPVPEADVPATVQALRDRLAQAPRSGLALERYAVWLGDALSLSTARDALPCAAALQALQRDLPRRVLRRENTLPAFVAALLKARDEATMLSLLSLLATARQERLAARLVVDHQRLREDLDLALPGPDYLKELYARVRGL